MKIHVALARIFAKQFGQGLERDVVHRRGIDADMRRAREFFLRLFNGENVLREQRHFVVAVIRLRGNDDDHLRDEDYGPGLPPPEAAAQSQRLVEFATDSSAILVRRSPRDLAFFHRVLQEYLAAETLERRPIEDQLAVVRERCTDPQ